MQNYTAELLNEIELGPCKDCGNSSKRVTGFIHSEKGTEAAYFVEWTSNRPDHPVSFDLILGKWGDSTGLQDRFAVSLQYLKEQNNFMVIDAAGRINDNEMISKAYTREEALKSDVKEYMFEIVDAVWLNDPRLEEIKP